MSSILTRLLEKGLPTRDVQIATTGEQQQRPIKFEGVQDGNPYTGDLLVVGGQDDTGIARHFNLDSNGRMVITGQSSNGGAVLIEGKVAENGTASTAKPIIIAGRYDAVPRTVPDGALGALAINAEGKLMMDLQNASINATVNVDIDQSTDSIQLYANDGAANRAVLSDASGRLVHVGAAASGAAVAGNPVLQGGSDGTNARTIRTDTAGSLTITGNQAYQALLTNNPVTIGVKSKVNNSNLYPLCDGQGHLYANARVIDGSGTYRDMLGDSAGRTVVLSATAVGDSWETYYPFMQGVAVEGANTVQTALGDSSGRQVVVGGAASGDAVAGNPILIAGQDGTNARSLQTNTAGALSTQPKATSRIHQQRCYVNATDGSTTSRVVHMRFTGVYTYTTWPFLDNTGATTLTMVAGTNVGYDHYIRVFGIGASNEELEETMFMQAGSTTSAASLNSYKNINDIRMITSMEPGNNIFGALGANPECFEVGANYHENPFFMCPVGYKARLKGITGYFATTAYSIGLQVYDNNSSARIPGLYFSVASTTTELIFPEPGAYELTAGQGVYWVADGSASGTCHFTALWELVPL